jgi:cell fate (sporulation/competence/biofilm development) regulator YmcA (YheA/YmcA/DUF963 family)
LQNAAHQKIAVFLRRISPESAINKTENSGGQIQVEIAELATDLPLVNSSNQNGVRPSGAFDYHDVWAHRFWI